MYIYTHKVRFLVIYFAHVLCLFQVLSTVQQTRVHWILSWRKEAPWYNSLLLKFRNGMYSLVFTSETIIRRVQTSFGVNLKTVRRIQKDLDDSYRDYECRVVWQPHSNRSDKKRSPQFVGEIPVIIDNNPSKSINPIPINLGDSELLIRQIVHEDILYFSCKMRKDQFLSQSMKNEERARC